jgi:GNAT superfamily N-acetyltransferase
VIGSLATALAVLRRGRLDVLLYELRRRIHSEVVYIGGALDLEGFRGLPRLAAGLSLRPITPADHPYFTEFSSRELDVIGVLSRINAARRLESGIETCYAVVGEDGLPCHMEYLVRADGFDQIEELFPGRFPRLDEDEGLLDYPYTPEECRGRGVALFAIAAIAETAKGEGLRRLIQYAPTDNPQMLKLCEWAGFVPFVERTESFSLFRRRMTFRDLPAGTSYPTGGAARPNRLSVAG